MAQIEVTARMARKAFDRLYDHLFPGDGDEHGAVLLCGVQRTGKRMRLLVRQVVLAEEGTDFVLSRRGYKELTAPFVAKWARYCAERGLAYIAVHNHFDGDRVSFSGNDLASHERGYPALLQLTKGGPVGAFVFATRAVAGDIWTEEGRFNLSSLTVVGPQVRVFRPRPLELEGGQTNDVFDRHRRLFGSQGQAILSTLKGVIIGAGGGGSLANEWLARLGVGQLVTIDPKRIKESNRPRIVGAIPSDFRRQTPKVEIAKRVARAANPRIKYDAVFGDVRDEKIARKCTDADFLILAGDTFSSRNVFNRLVQQYLIPGFHVGTKVETDAEGRVTRIRAESRIVLPDDDGGCLRCEGLVPADRLRLEELTPEEFKAQDYLGQGAAIDVPEPSVITLNVVSAAQVVNDIMMMFTGLYAPDVELESIRYDVTRRRIFSVGHKSESDCPHCSPSDGSAYGMGDRMSLPCKVAQG